MQDFLSTERFEVLNRLGAGGMGVVYEVYDRERQQKVALKTLLHADAKTIYRFKREFRSLAEMVHPNLVSLYELFSDGDQWYFTMELLEDRTDLVAWAGRRALDADQATATMTTSPSLPAGNPDSAAAARMQPLAAFDGVSAERVRQSFWQLAQGVQTLHQAGKLHRDLKPGNVMVRGQGSVVVLDFGLVIERGPKHFQTSTEEIPDSSGGHSGSYNAESSIAGTIPYMSPEQASGAALTEASDWYAVGVMLFETLTGRWPFHGRPVDILRAKQSSDPPAPSDFVRGIPEDLNQLCVQLLQRDPATRPRGADVLSRLSAEFQADRAPEEWSIPAEMPFIGREGHIAKLIAAFDTALQGHSVIAHVHGKSGSGKTSLVENFLEELAAQRQVLIFRGKCYEQESVPYKAVDSVVDAITTYLQHLTANEVESLIPDHVVALARIFPVLKKVSSIAQMAESAPGFADLTELRRHAFASLRELLGRIARRNPLLICIDDLQWGDMESAALLSEILRPPELPRFLLLVCYRSEYAETSACLRALADLEKSDDGELRVLRLPVEALSASEAHDLTSRLLGSHSQAEEMANRIVEESGGSPYFINELVRFSQSGKAGAARAGDLDGILWMRVQQLPDDARKLLEVVAVSGQPLRLRYAQQAAGLPPISPKLIVTLRLQHLVRSSGPGLDDEFETYHDRIRESVLANLVLATRKQHHGGLALCLEQAGGVAPQILAVHFQGADQTQKAGHYYEQAADQSVHALAFERAEDFYNRALGLVNSSSQRTQINEKLIHFYTDVARFKDAYETGRRAIEPFGMRLPATFSPPRFMADFAQAKLRLLGRDVSKIVDLPLASKPNLAETVRLMSDVGKAAYQIRPELCIAVLVKLVNRCLKFGNTPDCAIGYMAFGTIFLGGVMGDHKTGYEFGRLSLDLVEKYNNSHQRAEVNFVVGYFGTSWRRPATEAEDLWKVAYRSGMETGDLFHTGCACCATIMSYFMRGLPLANIEVESEKNLDLLRRFNLREPIGAIHAVRQAIRNLQGQTRDRTSFSTSDFDEERYVKDLAGYGSRHFAHYHFIAKMQTLYLWGEYEKARAAANASAKYLRDSTGMLHSAEHFFYYALILAALYPRGTFRQRVEWFRAIRKIHRQFRKWAAGCPHNFLHKERLIAAEICRITGDPTGAAKLCEEAARAAAGYNYPHIEALACKHAANLYNLVNDRKTADRWIERAEQGYRRWGANYYANWVSNRAVLG